MMHTSQHQMTHLPACRVLQFGRQAGMSKCSVKGMAWRGVNPGLAQLSHLRHVAMYEVRRG